MNSGKGPTQFQFDFTRADRVLWSYGRRTGEQEAPGTPAGFFVDDVEIADHFSHTLDAVMADLVDIAVAVHMADRLAVRTVETASTWSRRIEATICVRNPGFWMNALLKERVQNLLNFLTEDTWILSFVLRQDSLRRSELQTHLPLPKAGGDLEVSLFSGGIDSFAGNASEVTECQKHFIFVSASPNAQQQFRQQQQVRLVRQELGGIISHVCVPYGMYRGDEYAQDATRRTRGFLFLVLGGVTALSAGSSSLFLYENGLGAINLPYDESQIGTDNARAVHPKTLRQTGELLTLVGKRQFSILNRSIYQTKAEMLRHPGIARVPNGIPLTFSCDGFPVRAKGHAQCGFCTSCLLRRYSLEAAGLASFDSEGYLQDWKAGFFKPTAHHLRGLRAMDWQVLRLKKCFSQYDPWHALCFEFPELRTAVSSLLPIDREGRNQTEVRITRMLRQHTADWPNFSALRLLNATGGQVA